MSRKRFTTLVAVVLLLGAAGLISLYMTLGRMNAMLRSQGHGGAPGAGGEKIEQMTLTPAGESQLRADVEHVRESQAHGAAAPAPANTDPPASPAAADVVPPTAPAAPKQKTPASSTNPAAAPAGASGSAGR